MLIREINTTLYPPLYFLPLPPLLLPPLFYFYRDVSKSVLTKYAKDVFIYTDYYKGDESGKSPGFALSLVAETTTGCLIGAECVAGEVRFFFFFFFFLRQ